MEAASIAKTTAAKTARAARGTDARRKKVQRAAVLLKQVSDPTRLLVLTMLAEGERHVGALCETLTQSQPAVSHHLALLRHGGIIVPRRQGKNNFYHLSPLGEQLAALVGRLL
jgi:DNA-binding transcriptional ArsR family regulator